MLIRYEEEQDTLAIEALLKSAFADHPYSKNNEYLLVAALRQDNALNLCLVAEENGKVIGYIAFSSVLINGKDLGWQGVGPLAVLPECQSQGIGTELMNKALAILKETHTKGCVLVGFPDYYQRFGFKADSCLTIKDIPAEFFMALSFVEDTPAGEVTFHKAFLEEY